MDQKIALLLFTLASSTIFFSFASAAGDVELMEMRDAVMAIGGDWAAIEEFLSTLSGEDRDLVIDTYPERIAELEEIRRSIEESGAVWVAGLNTVSILPPELRPGTGALPSAAKAGGVPSEIVAVSPGGGGPAAMALPDFWDWRNVSGEDWTTPIKDQGTSCESGWAFAALAAIESRVKLAADNPDLDPDLSEQHLLSCSPGNCSGANSGEIADWMISEGTVDEACFPYAGLDTLPCSESCPDRNSRKYKSEGWLLVCGNEYVVDVERIKQEVFSGGPVSTYMRAYDDFLDYQSGIYEHATGAGYTDHWVDIVGWGSENGTDYWICKNSWGTGWGEDGWFRIKMGEAEMGTWAIAYQPKIRGKLLFYEGHNPFYGYNLSAGYSEWGNRLAASGYLVHSSSTTPLTAELLSCYDVVVISSPGLNFSESELAAVKEFVGRGRVIAAGDGDLFAGDFIYEQDNERMAVEYVDWLASGEGGGLLIMGGEYVDWLPPMGTGGPEPLIGNDNANQIAELFGLHFNTDVIFDPLRYDEVKSRPVLGPRDDLLVINASSLSISKDAFALARTTASGYSLVPTASDMPSDPSAC